MQSLHAFLLRRDFIMLSTRWFPLYATNLGQDCAMLNTSAPAYTCAEQDGHLTGLCQVGLGLRLSRTKFAKDLLSQLHFHDAAAPCAKKRP